MKKLLVLSLSILAVGLFLTACGSSDNGGGCTKTSDCVSQGTNYFCDLKTKQCECAPACTGNCCGDDGCGGTCTDTCSAGTSCNQASCECEADTTCTTGQTRCNGNLAEACVGGAWTTDEDCAASGATCVNGVCQGGSCTSGTSRCNGNVVENCVASAWTTGTNCATNGEVCVNGACEAGGNCTDGQTRCNGNVIQTCNANNWTDGTNCAAGGQICSNGACTDVVTGDECPQGQDCTDVSGDGYLGCTEGGAPPAGAMTGCGENNPCPSNQTCFDDGNGGTICSANCGTCGQDLTCEDLSGDGGLGCVTYDGYIPAGAPTDCGQNGCTGNATCWCLNQDCSNNVCLDNCTVDGACTNGTKYCDGNTVMTCSAGAWVVGENCAASQLLCSAGECVASVPAGQFCEGQPDCASGLDCVGAANSQAFCTPKCDCNTGAGCTTTPTSDCLFADNPQAPTTCWCGFLCPGNDVSQCPNSGTGWTCNLGSDGQTYYCLPQ